MDSEKKKDFYSYTIRVSVAACAALVLLFGGKELFTLPAEMPIRPPQIQAPDLSKLDQFSQDLRDFSNKLIIKEDYHVKEEK